MRLTARIISFLFFLCLLPANTQAALPGFMLKKMGTMKGQLMVNGKPHGNALVSLFKASNGLPPVGENMRRVPEFLARTTPEGNFTVKLAPGDYYIGMMIREPGAAPGPPREGEKFYFAGEDDNTLRKFPIKELEEVDIGSVNGLPPEVFKEVSDLFTVEGVLINGKTGKPHEGAIAMAKITLNKPRPDFISNKTKADGTFKLKLMAGTSYFLIARETIAGSRPRPGDSMGTYGILSSGNTSMGSIFGASPPPGVFKDDKLQSDRALTVTGDNGEVLKGIEIMMFEVPNPQAIKESLQGTANSPRFESGAKLNNILFATNSHEITSGSKTELEKWVSFLKGRPEVKIELSGHTDNVGDDQYNLELSKRRASSIAAYLNGSDIDKKRVVARGYGEKIPVANNASAEGRKRNRRVEIKFLTN